eukprot:gene1723-3336_t
MFENNMETMTGAQDSIPPYPEYGWSMNGYSPSVNIDQSMDPAVLQQTRHARRLYVGGIPQNYANEELIIKHFNSIISEGLCEENDSSYVNSVYINHKKCFAFVELKSMELTTACLELDGIVYHNSILKIQRANEYKPELVPGPTRPPLKLKLPSSAYLGTAVAAPPEIRETNEPRMGSLVQQGMMSNVERGAIVLIGFPYDEGGRRAGGNVGSAASPKVIRRFLRKVGTVQNPEYDIDLSHIRFVDIGDISLGMALEEAQSRLTQTVTEIIRRGALPIVIGGSADLSYYNASALMSVAGGNIGVVSIDSRLGVRPPNMEGKTHSGTPFRQLLEDTRFCSPRDGLNSMPSCEGKFVSFGAQGSLCNDEHSKFITSRGGFILWLAKDIRTTSTPSTTGTNANSKSGQIFEKALKILGENPTSGGRRPLFVSIHMSAMSASVSPGVEESGSLGLNGDEALEMCQICGTDQNVVLLDFSDFNPEVEEARTGKLAAEMIYYFALGFAARMKAAVQRDTQSSSSSFKQSALNSNAAPFTASYSSPYQPMSASSMSSNHSSMSHYPESSTMGRHGGGMPVGRKDMGGGGGGGDSMSSSSHSRPSSNYSSGGRGDGGGRGGGGSHSHGQGQYYSGGMEMDGAGGQGQGQYHGGGGGGGGGGSFHYGGGGGGGGRYGEGRGHRDNRMGGGSGGGSGHMGGYGYHNNSSGRGDGIVSGVVATIE